MKRHLTAAALSCVCVCACALAAGQVPATAPGDALPGPFRAPPPEADTSWIERQFHNIAYGQSPAQQLDVYLPDAAAGPGPYPVVIAIHGGAFQIGDKADMQLNAPLQSVRRGFAVVSLNYRMSGEAPFPAAVQDVKAAVRFLRAHAAEFHLDRRMMIAWGDSAGGNLAAMLGTTSATRQFDDATSRNGDQSSAVQGVVDWYGPIYFDLMDAQFRRNGKGRPDHGAAGSPESRYLGGALADMPAQVKAASPATYATAAIPPFLIQQGTDDENVPAEQSVMFAASLRRLAGHDRVELSLLPGARHGGPAFETAENMDRVFAFLDRVRAAAKGP